jgi:hypothetical protein
MLSTTIMPEILEYPESGKAGANNASGGRIVMTRPGAKLEYWDGEE